MDSNLIFPFSHNNNHANIKNFSSVIDYGYEYKGQELIDLSLGSCGCFPLGFKRVDFASAIYKQLQEYPFLSGDFLTTNDHVTELSRRLSDLSGGYRSIFALSGSDTVEASIKVARTYQSLRGKSTKKLMLGFENSYHGSTFLSSSISGSTYIHAIQGRHPECRTLPNIDDVAHLTKIIDDLGPENICCLIVESCSWQAGLYPHTKEWWKQLREVCRSREIVFIIDDIAFCGAKTGKYFGFHEGLNPDIICTGKALSGGYSPLSCCLINDEMFQMIKEPRFLHGFSYSFSMSGIISALHYLNVIDSEKIYNQYSTVSDASKKLFDGLAEIKSVKAIRNYGLTWCIDIDFSEISEEKMFQLFVDNGMFLGLWNHPSKHKQILIHTPNVYDDSYFFRLSKNMTALLKAIA
jgi:putrescine aminotransferase